MLRKSQTEFHCRLPPERCSAVLAGSVRATLAAPARLQKPLLRRQGPLQSLWLERVRYSPARYSL